MLPVPCVRWRRCRIIRLGSLRCRWENIESLAGYKHGQTGADVCRDKLKRFYLHCLLAVVLQAVCIVIKDSRPPDAILNLVEVQEAVTYLPVLVVQPTDHLQTALSVEGGQAAERVTIAEASHTLC